MKPAFTFLEQRIFSISTILFCALLLQLGFARTYPPGWDASVYVLMGKYVFSSGEVGLIEPFRPILWPGILGLFWKTGWDPIVAGRFLGLVFVLGNIFLTYKIGEIIFDKKIGLLGAWLLCLSPALFFWGQSVYTDIPSSFLGLLAVYLFLKESHFLSGIFGALAFQTRFVQLLSVLPVVLYQVVRAFISKKPVALIKFSIGFLLFLAPFLVFYYLNYGNMFYPLTQAQEKYTQFSFVWYEGIIIVFKKLIYTEGLFLFFILPSFIGKFKKDHTSNFWLIVLLAAVLILWIGKYPFDVARYSIGALPYLYLLAALGMRNVFEYLNHRQRKLAGLFIILISFLMIYQVYRVITIRFPSDRLTVFQDYVVKNEDVLKEKKIWISSPRTLVFSNLKAANMMYYHNIKESLDHLSDADFIFLDSRDIPCVSRYDETCEADKIQLISRLKNEYQKDFYQESPDQKTFVGIFHRQK